MRFYLVIVSLIFLLTGCGSTHQNPKGNLNYSNTAISQKLNAQLKEWQGTPYRYGGTTRKGIDCSSFVQNTFAQRFKFKLPRTTKQQMVSGQKISKNNLKAGDLVFFKTGRSSLHVGIYDKNNQFIHASTSKGVTRSSLNNTYWKKRFLQARRM